MRNTLAIGLDLLYAERCSLCGDLLSSDREWRYPVCGMCEAELAARDGPLCSVCSTRLVSEKDICTRCRNRHYLFTSNYSLFIYEGKTKELINQFKAKNVKPLAGFFAARMAPVIQDRHCGFAVVPVPYRSTRKRARGWDQIEAICRELRRNYGIRFHPILKRRNSAAQKSLDYQGRLENLKGNVYLRKHAHPPDKVLLIDDVFTTGATADACAAALKSAGVREVRMLSIALDQ